jgi:hypothetical protein
LAAGNYIVNANVGLIVSDTVAGGQASLACKLIDTPSGGGAIISDTALWATPINVVSTADYAQNALPLTLPVSSEAHPSAISIACYTLAKEANGGTIVADANNAAITAVQTTLNS